MNADEIQRMFTLRIPVTDRTKPTAFAAHTIVIRAFDAGPYPYPDRHHKIAVTVTFQGETIFALGDTYCGTPGGTSVDGDEARELVCSLIAMRPGDTDEEYFASYTPAQLDFANQYGEEISQYAERYKCQECGAVTGRSKSRWVGKRCSHHKREKTAEEMGGGP